MLESKWIVYRTFVEERASLYVLWLVRYLTFSHSKTSHCLPMCSLRDIYKLLVTQQLYVCYAA